MPNYEYTCDVCSKVYRQFLIHTDKDEDVRCPCCDSKDKVKTPKDPDRFFGGLPITPHEGVVLIKI